MFPGRGSASCSGMLSLLLQHCCCCNSSRNSYSNSSDYVTVPAAATTPDSVTGRASGTDRTNVTGFWTRFVMLSALVLTASQLRFGITCGAPCAEARNAEIDDPYSTFGGSRVSKTYLVGAIPGRESC